MYCICSKTEKNESILNSDTGIFSDSAHSLDLVLCCCFFFILVKKTKQTLLLDFLLTCYSYKKCIFLKKMVTLLNDVR